MILATMIACAAMVHGVAHAATPAEAEAQLEKAANACGKDLGDLAKWFERKGNAGVADRFRAEALWFRPDDARLRKSLGFTREGEDWVLPSDALVRFRDTALGAPLPADKDAAKQIAKTRTKAVKRLHKLAKGIKAPDGAGADVAAEFAAVRSKALELLLRIAPDDEEARRALGYVDHGGRLVHPDVVAFLDVRDADLREAKAVLEQGVASETNTPENGMPRAVTDSLMITSFSGLSLAQSAVVRATQGVRVVEKVYELPEAFRSNLQRRDFVVVGSEDQHKHVATVLYQRKAAAVVQTDETNLRRYGKLNLLVFEPDEEKATAILSAGAVRVSVSTLFRLVFDKVPKEDRKAEAWVQDAMTMDVLDRAFGTIHPTIGIELRQHLVGPCRTGADWIERARRQALHGVDPPIAELARTGPWKMGGHHLAKAYAFLRFLFETNTDKARGFVLTAMVSGSEKAATAAFEQPLAELEEAYGRWILLGR